MALRVFLATVLCTVSLTAQGAKYIVGFESSSVAEMAATSGTVTLESTTVNSGSYAVKMTGTATVAQATVATPATEGYARVYFRKEADSGSTLNLITIESTLDGIQGQVQLEADGTLHLIHGTATADGTADLGNNQWYRIDVRYKNGPSSNGILEVRVDGTVDATISTGDLNNTWAWFNLHGIHASSAVYWDDFRWLNGAGSYLADGEVTMIRPDAAGSEVRGGGTDFNGSFADIDDTPINESTTTSKTDSASSTFLDDCTTISDVGTINSAEVGGWLKRGNGGATNHRLRVNVSGTAAQSGDLVITNTYNYYSYYKAGEVPTSQAELDGAEIGAAHDGARDYDIAELYMMIDRTPPAASGLTQAPFINFPLTFD